MFGPKEQSNNIIEDIIEEIELSTNERFSLAKIIFTRLFDTEVKSLLESLKLK